MMEAITTYINQQIEECGPLKVVSVSVALGMVSYPLFTQAIIPTCKKITLKAIGIFEDCWDCLMTTTVMLRLRSLCCHECAKTHKGHLHLFADQIRATKSAP